MKLAIDRGEEPIFIFPVRLEDIFIDDIEYVIRVMVSGPDVVTDRTAGFRASAHGDPHFVG